MESVEFETTVPAQQNKWENKTKQNKIESEKKRKTIISGT